MSTLVAKILVVIALSHGLRWIGKRAGARWGALALGLPCTSTIALVGCAIEQGETVARRMAEQSLLGLAGAVALPLAFAEAGRRGSKLAGSVMAAFAAFLGVAWLARWLGDQVDRGALPIAALAVLTGIALSTGRGAAGDRDRALRGLSRRRVLALRTLVPVACLLAVLAAGEVSGPVAAGLLATFPGLGLTLLILARVEGGARASERLAHAYPLGNLGMLAFLASFQMTVVRSGVAWSLAVGYASAVMALAGAVLMTRQSGRPIRRARPAWPALELAPAWPRPGRSCRPRVESLAA